MPDEKGQTESSEQPAADTSLHAYKEGREHDIEGDTENLLSNDPEKQQLKNVKGDDEESLAPEKH